MQVTYPPTFKENLVCHSFRCNLNPPQQFPGLNFSIAEPYTRKTHINEP